MNETLKSVLIAVLVLALVLFGVTESKIEFANGVVKLLLIIVVFYGNFAVTYFVGTYPFKGLPQKLTESDNGFLKSLGYIIWALLGIGVLFLFVFVSEFFFPNWDMGFNPDWTFSFDYDR